MYYTIYKITNMINDKIYIGMHKTSNLNDNYMGSGKIIKSAIKKYGIENFKKEYIDIFDNRQDMINMETKIVNEDFVEESNNYNIVIGGEGGFDYINKNYPIEKRKEIGKKIGSKAGSWEDKEKRLKVWKSVPVEKRKEIGKKLGDTYGGFNKLTDDIINERLEKIKDIDLMKFGWVTKVSKKLDITHTQVKRFIDKYYTGDVYRRN